ncbi:carboxylesterase family protein [Nocardioides sp.]|uniref:carboxylesterase/lipase family protein n=1 Tax=Nocardioides sp. TaxID=35761 RepID=UPI003219CCB4
MAALVLTIVVVASVLLVTGPGSEPSASGEPLVVATEQGRVRGVDEQGVRTWRGIPYAAAPVGDLRWRAPVEPPGWEGERDAGTFGAPCLQPAGYRYGDRDLKPRRTSSEDCLYLNVTSAYGEDTSGSAAARPVIVWLHGGGLFEGNGSLVDPTVLAEHDAVVVTVNYRLGLLGFFAHPSLDQDIANFALLDQIAALEWVRDNIEGFGGDPDNVTVMGGSAGAISVNALMVAPGAQGLFDRAISQSAPGDSAARTIRDVRREGARAFRGLSATELQALPPEDLLSSTFNVLLGDAPIVDSVLPERVAEAFAAGREASVPYLVGTTSGEFSDGDFRASGSNPARIRARLGATDHDALVAAYGRRAFREYVLDDLVFHAPAASLALEHAERAPTYRYRFGPDRDGSTHGAEVPYVFGSEDRPGRQALTEAMVDYWVAFARSGEPEVQGLPTWPRAAGTSYLDLGEDGAHPVARDPWTRRLRALYETVPLQLPESLSGARGR